MQREKTPGVLAHVSANVRHFRATADLSQVALAERSGISRRTIVKLEAGEANISLTGLDHLADALGVTFVDLVAAPAAPRADIRELAWQGDVPGSAAVLLASVPAAVDAQLWSWVLEPGDRYDAEPDPVGWSEMLIVFEGSLHIDKEDGAADLSTGDHLAFATSQQYAYVNITDVRVRFMRVVVS
ncbi:Cro/Cl family transcriptional regulator [Rathayibacter tritici]|uniref:XRE family transcriptional regulator n=1 Tax=Rathayibacter tritici TaxID=33888 RepID=UPI000CE8873B|nr:XRE family transcriptional regulator [Rathayibacter tritici]PPF23509.1 Cro/Cl family transcriptional regulator [Rathayibacter tritici]PPI19045.1 Cro/Cl family transcriptional regulator [Rathayibacter tritici]